MSSVVLISSVINPPQKPLSYTKSRSVFTMNDRFEHTKKTIESIKQKIPNPIIIIIECSILSGEIESWLKEHVDFYINVYDDEKLRERIYSESKSKCESTQLIYAMDYILKNNIKADNFIKISGRYWLSDKFDYANFDNDKVVVKQIRKNKNNIFTALYKLPYNLLQSHVDFWKQQEHQYDKCVGLEVIFAQYVKTIPEQNKVFHDVIGLEGYVSICGSHYDG